MRASVCLWLTEPAKLKLPGMEGLVGAGTGMLRGEGSSMVVSPSSIHSIARTRQKMDRRKTSKLASLQA